MKVLKQDKKGKKFAHKHLIHFRSKQVYLNLPRFSLKSIRNTISLNWMIIKYRKNRIELNRKQDQANKWTHISNIVCSQIRLSKNLVWMPHIILIKIWITCNQIAKDKKIKLSSNKQNKFKISGSKIPTIKISYLLKIKDLTILTQYISVKSQLNHLINLVDLHYSLELIRKVATLAINLSLSLM